jgi:hypothetical protein
MIDLANRSQPQNFPVVRFPSLARKSNQGWAFCGFYRFPRTIIRPGHNQHGTRVPRPNTETTTSPAPAPAPRATLDQTTRADRDESSRRAARRAGPAADGLSSAGHGLGRPQARQATGSAGHRLGRPQARQATGSAGHRPGPGAGGAAGRVLGRPRARAGRVLGRPPVEKLVDNSVIRSDRRCPANARLPSSGGGISGAGGRPRRSAVSRCIGQGFGREADPRDCRRAALRCPSESEPGRRGGPCRRRGAA